MNGLNSTNRGALRGIAISLAAMRDAIEGMCLCEWSKEDGDNAPPLEGRFSSTSSELEEAAMFVNAAIKVLHSIAEKPADFEEYIGVRKVPEDVEYVINYGDDESRW